MSRVTGIDYSKWDKMNFGDSSEDDDEKLPTPSSLSSDERPKGTSKKVVPPDSMLSSNTHPPNHSIYTRKTRVRHTFEYNFDNMTPSDWEERKVITDRLGYLNNAYGFGETGFPQYYEMDMDACRKLRDDIEQHRNFWLEEIFHPLEADKDPSNVERAVIALCSLSSHYHRKRKYEKALDVAILLTDVMECYRVMVFQNPRFEIGKEQKKRFRFREYTYHGKRYNAASLLGKRDMAVESFRRCAQLELAGAVPAKEATFIDLLKPEYRIIGTLLHEGSPSSNFHEFLETFPSEKAEELIASLNAPPLTIVKLRNEITDDDIWSIISRAASSYKKGSEFIYSGACPVCASSENLKLCSCGQVAYCSPGHQFTHFQHHKKICKCPVCGSNEKLKLCSGCQQIAFCSQDHAVAYWSQHKKDCKKGGKGEHIGKEAEASPKAMAEIFKNMYAA